MDSIVYQNAIVASTTVTMLTDVLKLLEVHVCFKALLNQLQLTLEKSYACFSIKFYVESVIPKMDKSIIFIYLDVFMDIICYTCKPISSAIAKCLWWLFGCKILQTIEFSSFIQSNQSNPFFNFTLKNVEAWLIFFSLK